MQTVVISPWVWSGMVYSSENTDLEVGGILMGALRRSDGLLVLGLAAGPGPNALQRHGGFDRDIPANRGFFRSTATLYPMGFVGLWHCHPSSPGFSAQDLVTWRTLVDGSPSAEKSWNLIAAVLPILGRDSSGRVNELRMYYLERGWLRPREIPWRIASPDDPVLGLAYHGYEGPAVFMPSDLGPGSTGYHARCRAVPRKVIVHRRAAGSNCNV